MREREIVLRLRLPRSPRTRWLLTAAAVLLFGSAIVYAAALKTFTAGQPLKAADLTANFNQISTHTHPVSVGLTNQVSVALANGPAVTTACAVCPGGSIAVGGNCRVTPFPACDSANVTMVGAGVDVAYPGGIATNNNQYCCRGILNSQPQTCNLGAWAICVSATSVGGLASQSTLQTGVGF